MPQRAPAFGEVGSLSAGSEPWGLLEIRARLGHPDLEAVDVSFIGYWGEGDGGHLLSGKTRHALINAYLDNFKKTHLIFQPLNGDAPDPGVLVKGLPIAAYWPDGRDNGTGPQMRHLGWRIDCLGDMDFWPEWGWNHMTDVYPQDIIRSGMSEAWKKAPGKAGASEFFCGRAHHRTLGN